MCDWVCFGAYCYEGDPSLALRMTRIRYELLQRDTVIYRTKDAFSKERDRGEYVSDICGGG